VTAYLRPDYQTLTSLIRSLLNDEAPEVPITYTDASLIAPASAAQRSVQAALARNGVGIHRTEIIFTVPAGTTALSFAVAPDEDVDPPAAFDAPATDIPSNIPIPDAQFPAVTPPAVPPLPDDLVTVISIGERDPSTSQEWRPVDRCVDEFPSIVTDRRLNHWRWTAGEIQFVAATSDREIKLAYVRALPDFDGGPALLAIPFSMDAIAWKTIANAEFSRNNPSLRALAREEYANALDDLLGILVGDELNEPVRRRPYGTAG
jgi:hypothetical protein